jgi:hypothetical protein
MYPCLVTEMCRGSAHSFIYVEADAPEGMTLREWRSVRPARIGRREGARESGPKPGRASPSS